MSAEQLLYKPNKTREDVDALLLEHKNLIYFMLGRCGAYGDQDCESAAFEGLWNAIETFNIFDNTAFSTYACTCIRNAINNVRRKQKACHEHEILFDFTDPSALPSIVSSVDVEDMSTVERIHAATKEYIDKQPKQSNSAKVIQTWYSYQFSIATKDIAKLCNTSSANVSRIQDTFRAYLRRKLGE